MPTYDSVQDATTYPRRFESKPHELLRFYKFQTAKSVLITGGVATIVTSPTPAQIFAADDGSGEAGKAFFRGGTIPVTITSAEATALTNAGLEVT